MSQSYADIPDTTSMQDSLAPLLARDDAAKTNFSGTTFPSVAVGDEGMTCYRSDQKITYRLSDATVPTWVPIDDLTKTYLSQEGADARYLALAGGAMTGDETFANQKGVKAKDSGGTARNVANVTAASLLALGDAAIAAQWFGTSHKITPAGGTDDSFLDGQGANLDTYLRSGKAAGKVVVGDTSAAVNIGKAATTTELLGALKVDQASTLVGAVDAQGGLNVSSGTLQKAGVDVMLSGKHGIWIPGHALVIDTAGALTSVGSGGSSGLARGPQFDPSTNQQCFFSMFLPSSWNYSALIFRYVWAAASGTGDVRWGVQSRWLRDGEAVGTAFTNSTEVTDTLITAGSNIQITGDMSITPDGALSGGGMLNIRAYRNAANAADTLATNAILLGIMILPTFTGAADA